MGFGYRFTRHVAAPPPADAQLWLDADGSVADAPVTDSGALAAATLVVVVGWLTAIGLLTLAQFVLHRVLDGHRFGVWGEEWAR